MDEGQRKMLFSLVSTIGIGAGTIKQLHGLCDGDWQLLKSSNVQQWQAIAGIRQASRKFDAWQFRLNDGTLDRDWDKVTTGNRFVLAIDQKEYPRLLREMPDPPPMLFLKGNSAALSRPAIAIVGTRSCTVYGKTMANRLASQLSTNGWTIVSGLARGIDAHAHDAAVRQGGSTIAVMAGGLDVVYPPEHAELANQLIQEGLLMTEQPDGTILQAGLFPLRNRIIAGLSHATIVVEAAEQSGSLITTDLALQYNREVFAVPGPVTSPKSQGPLALLVEGATLIRHADDVEHYLSHVFRDRLNGRNEQDTERFIEGQKPIFLTDEEQVLYGCLGTVPTFFTELQEMTKYDLGQLHRVLLSLQMKNRIMLSGPMNYVRME